MATRGYTLALRFVCLAIGVVSCRADDIARPEVLETEASAAAALSFVQLSAGHEHTCGVTSDSRAYCWGSNSQGQLGDGTGVASLIPVAVAGALRFRQISAGFFTTCGVTTDFRAYCWGINDRGEVGDGTTTQRLAPVAVASGVRFRHVRLSFEHACGLSNTGNKVYCWGWNRYGQLGDRTTIDRLTPVLVTGGLAFREVSAGYYHTCGVTTGDRVFCWGFNRYGQVGDGSQVWKRLKPTAVSGGLAFRQVEANREHTCAVTTAKKVYCWGRGLAVGLAGALDETTSPIALPGGLTFDRVTTGAFHSCGETPANLAYCWGIMGTATSATVLARIVRPCRLWAA